MYSTFVLLHWQQHRKLIQSHFAAAAVSATRVGSCGAQQSLTSSIVPQHRPWWAS